MYKLYVKHWMYEFTYVFKAHYKGKETIRHISVTLFLFASYVNCLISMRFCFLLCYVFYNSIYKYYIKPYLEFIYTLSFDSDQTMNLELSNSFKTKYFLWLEIILRRIEFMIELFWIWFLVQVSSRTYVHTFIVIKKKIKKLRYEFVYFIIDTNTIINDKTASATHCITHFLFCTSHNT